MINKQINVQQLEGTINQLTEVPFFSIVKD